MDLNRSIIRSKVRQALQEYLQSNTNRSANAGEAGRLEGSCKLILLFTSFAHAFFINRQEQTSNRLILGVNMSFTATTQNTSTTSQRLNCQIGQVYQEVQSKINRPFPSSCLPSLQSEFKCEVFLVVISSILHMNEN